MGDDRILRERQIGLEDELEGSYATDTDCSPSMLVQTVTITTYPTSANVFYACNPVEVDGTPTEGGAATYTVDDQAVLYAFNHGSAIPDSGTKVIVHRVGGRWNFRYDCPPP